MTTLISGRRSPRVDTKDEEEGKPQKHTTRTQKKRLMFFVAMSFVAVQTK